MSHFRHCWVCFATEQDDPGAEWLSPCRCRGSTKWVHLTCLQYWLDTRLRVSQQPIRCQLCEVAYSVIFPQMGECQLIQGHIIGPQRCGGALDYPLQAKGETEHMVFNRCRKGGASCQWRTRSGLMLILGSCLSSGPLVDFLRVVDRTLTAIGPYGTLGLLVGTVYWTALSYGAVTVVQVHRGNVL